jgi:hypothetical protein
LRGSQICIFRIWIISTLGTARFISPSTGGLQPNGYVHSISWSPEEFRAHVGNI